MKWGGNIYLTGVQSRSGDWVTAGHLDSCFGTEQVHRQVFALVTRRCSSLGAVFQARERSLSGGVTWGSHMVGQELGRGYSRTQSLAPLSDAPPPNPPWKPSPGTWSPLAKCPQGCSHCPQVVIAELLVVSC